MSADDLNVADFAACVDRMEREAGHRRFVWRMSRKWAEDLARRFGVSELTTLGGDPVEIDDRYGTPALMCRRNPE